jgi:Phage major capsid protein E
MAHMDIFNNDAFSLVSMTAAVEKMPTVPSFLGSLGIFESEGIETNIASIEQVGQTLSLIKTSARGTAPAMGSTDKRSLRNFNIPRIAKSDQIFAAEIQGIRSFGTESELETVVQKVAQKQAKLLRETALTLEYHRLGAIQGILLDSDASTLYNYFTEFGISQPAEIDFDLDNASPARGVLMAAVKSVKRTIIRALGQAAPGIRVIRSSISLHRTAKSKRPISTGSRLNRFALVKSSHRSVGVKSNGSIIRGPTTTPLLPLALTR